MVVVEQDNLAAVRRGFEAFRDGDMAALAQLFHPDATWNVAPTGVLGGNRTGRDDIFAMFALLGAETHGSFSVVPNAFAAAGDRVFVQATARGQRNGRSIVSEEVLVFTLSQGQVRDVHLYVHDHPANVAFWS